MRSPGSIAEFFGAGAPRVIAHRGWSAAAPENTLAAFRRAVDLGVDMIELDVALSRDGEPVVIHDETLERTTDGRGRVADRTAAELAGLDAGSWFGAEFASERVPALDAVLGELGRRVLWNVEIKPEAVTADSRDGVVARVLRAVARHRLGDRVLLSSFDLRALDHARGLEPGIARAALRDPAAHALIGDRELVDPVGAAALHVERADATAERAAWCRARGLPFSVYTVDDGADMRAFIALGAAALFTNRPDVLLHLLGRG